MTCIHLLEDCPACHPPEDPGFAPQTQPSPWSCLPTAFAMVALENASDLIKQIGHDDARGFHVQEVLGILLAQGWAFTPFEFHPELDPLTCEPCEGTGNIWVRDVYSHVMSSMCKSCLGAGYVALEMKLIPVRDLMRDHDGVLLGRPKGSETFHAVAWSSRLQLCIDPRGTRYPFEQFEPDEFWLASEL